MNSQRTVLLFFLATMCVFSIGAVTVNVYIQTPLVTLKSSEQVFAETADMVAIAISPQDRKPLVVDRQGMAVIYDQDLKLSRSALAQIKGSFAFGPQGHLYFLESPSRLRVIDPSGISYATFPVPSPLSLGVLKDGNVVVAAPAKGHLFHVFNQIGGRLRSFGKTMPFDVVNKQQNTLLNTGKILVSPSNEIYYVYKYAPIVQKYTKSEQPTLVHSRNYFKSSFKV